ncbi:MAG: hypothetical protein QOF48_199 [Verrucomicrobiota bacterium]|jgi:hypothetical protein
MLPFDPNSFRHFMTPGSIPGLSELRFLRVLFNVPERALTSLAIRILGRSPPDFAKDFRQVSLKKIEKQLERQLVTERHFPPPLISYVFQPLRHVLNFVPPRDIVRDGKGLPQGNYALSAFFTTNEEHDMRAWLIANHALIELAMKKAQIDDPQFASEWIKNYKDLVSLLRRYVRKRGPSAEEIAHLAWLGIHMRHETGPDWSLGDLKNVALDIYRRHTRRTDNDVAIGEDIGIDDTLFEAPFIEPSTPNYLKVALLEVLLDGKSFPHEIIAFFYCRFLLGDPSKMVGWYGKRTLYELNSFNFASFLEITSLPDITVREFFDRFELLLARKVGRFATTARVRKTLRSVLELRAGWTRVADYLKRPGPHARAADVGHWCTKVQLHIQEQADTPGRPLNRAWLRWLNERRINGQE